MKETINNNADMTPEEFRKYGYEIVDWISGYIRDIKSYPVLPAVKPGEIKSKLPSMPPLHGETFEKIISDLNNIIMPGMTHWNHPNFMAYFNSTSSMPGMLAEFLSAAFNVNGMVWKTAPSSNELEERMLEWLRDAIGLPQNFWGIVYDTASVSSMHAIACARENIPGINIRQKGLANAGVKPLRLYASEQAHSSIEKGAVALGIGLDGVRKIKVDKEFKIIPSELKRAIDEDRENGWFPFCAVATIGTTSTTSIDPLDEIADICRNENIWLHVDAAHAGVTAILPEMKWILKGIEKADSFVVNPHKWMFVPLDFSAFYTSKPEVLKSAFSIVPDYLKTSEDNSVKNYMDYGIQLGRRFRSMKLWFVFRYFGIEGLMKIYREHLRLGKLFAGWIDEEKNFERLAPVPFSTICFRALSANRSEVQINKFNEKLLEEINSTGKVLLSHTILNGKFTIRLVVSGIRTAENDLRDSWQLINEKFNQLSDRF